MIEVALITLHGMGKVKNNYYVELESKLKKSLGDDWIKVSFQKVQYAPILQHPEDKLWNDMLSEPSNNLDSTKLRQFFLYGFGDAGSLEHSSHSRKEKYIAVQKEIAKAVEHAYLDLNSSEQKPVIIIAQSLGCQVISNYLWDAQNDLNFFADYNEDDAAKKSFMKLESLYNLITTGCNMPLFNAGLEDRQCFSKPNGLFVWDNYYDPDDPLGWPLKQLGESYHIVNDHAVNVGGLFTSWNPFSHGQYWGYSDVVDPLSNLLKSKIT